MVFWVYFVSSCSLLICNEMRQQVHVEWERVMSGWLIDFPLKILILWHILWVFTVLLRWSVYNSLLSLMKNKTIIVFGILFLKYQSKGDSQIIRSFQEFPCVWFAHNALSYRTQTWIAHMDQRYASTLVIQGIPPKNKEISSTTYSEEWIVQEFLLKRSRSRRTRVVSW